MQDVFFVIMTCLLQFHNVPLSVNGTKHVAIDFAMVFYVMDFIWFAVPHLVAKLAPQAIHQTFASSHLFCWDINWEVIIALCMNA